ncbi:MAG: imidazole glycerol phosphate synthase subunit HisH [Myxococcales bacterium]|nr:imidazole glycerol phosphate synthase subunit HisH [Myxococcales bacterium]
MSVTVVDYGMGNIASLRNAFAKVGAEVSLSHDADEIASAERLALPGVGAFGRCTAELRERGIFEAVAAALRSGRPVLGICLGFQVLFERSTEFGQHQGFGRFAGVVDAFDSGNVVVPHMGWNSLELVREHPIFHGVPSGSHVYFLHSFRPTFDDQPAVLARTEYDGTFTSAVGSENVVGFQFHPEKSGPVGLRLLANFLSWKPK